MTGPRTEYEAELLDLARRRTAAEEEMAKAAGNLVFYMIALVVPLWTGVLIVGSHLGRIAQLLTRLP